ncbi:MAG: class I SAM-dependent methyltransferase [Bacteriovoracia bacterium]
MKDAVPRDYSLIAPVYDKVFNRFLNEGHRQLGSFLRKSRSPKKEIQVLEVGVGSGLTLDYLPASIRYTGIDINKRMLSLAHKKAERFKRRKISLSVMDAHRLSFKPNSFDLVLAASVITAVENPEQVMKEMVRVTKKGGKIAIVANIRNKSYRSQLVRRFDPLTKKFLGFRTDIDASYFENIKGIRQIENKEVNSLFGIPLSSFLVFEKI